MSGDLHNMSVPPRTVLTVARALAPGQRYRVDLRKTFSPQRQRALTASLRRQGSACVPDFFGEEIASATGEELRRICFDAVRDLRLPDTFGFFIDGHDTRAGHGVPIAAALGILAARSGPLYLPGRFEPSLINLAPVTLFFPFIDDVAEDATW